MGRDMTQQRPRAPLGHIAGLRGPRPPPSRPDMVPGLQVPGGAQVREVETDLQALMLLGPHCRVTPVSPASVAGRGPA